MTEGDETEDANAVDETPSAADPVSQKRVREKRKVAEDNYAGFWKRALADPIGREVLFTLLRDCGTFEFPVAQTAMGFPSTEKTWFELGKKSIGEALRDRLELADRAGLALAYDEWHPKFVKPKPPKRRKPDGE